MKRITFLSLFLLFQLIVGAQIKDTIEIKEVEVSSHRAPVTYSESSRIVSIISKEELKDAPVNTLEDVLELALNVDIRQRGAQGPQADVRVRGGSFEQTLILLNGMNMNDPQTGHHNMNLPVSLADIERIEILEGPGSRVFGPNAFSGAINIITNSKAERNLGVSLCGGSYGYYSGQISSSYNVGKLNNHISVSRNVSNGFTDNTDFEINNLYYQTIARVKKSVIKFQGGFLNKQFGANSFYTPKYPYQFEQTKTTFVGLGFESGGKTKIKADVYWRRHNDRFELLREDVAYYVNTGDAWINKSIGDTIGWYKNHNYHMTDVFGANFNTGFKSAFGSTAIGIDFRSEHIYSNVLGITMSDTKDIQGEDDAVFTKSKGRENIGVFAEHSFHYQKFDFSAGILANYHSDYDWNIYWGTDFSYNFQHGFKVFASVNQSLRVPSFTDLYYAGPSNIGNPELKPEKAITYETGLKFINSNIVTHGAVFYRRGTDMISWVRKTAEEPWQSRNLTEVSTFGIEFSAIMQLQKMAGNSFPVKTLSVSFCKLNQDFDSGEYESDYVLDFLKYKFTASANVQIYKGIGVVVSYNLQEREGKYREFIKETKQFGDNIDYKANSLVDARLFWNKKFWTIYLEAQNLFDVDYVDYGNVAMPGRWIKAGVKLNFELK